MKFLIVLTLLCLVGCSTGPVRLSYSQKLDRCITKYLNEGINAEEAVKVCQTIHGSR